jgi:hypothetical protein
MKINLNTARKYTQIGANNNINKGDLVVQENLTGMRDRKQLKKLGHISLLSLAQKRNVPARDIKKLKNWLLKGNIHVAGSVSHDTKYLYEEGGNILNHTNFGNKKTLTKGQERDRYNQGGL